MAGVGIEVMDDGGEIPDEETPQHDLAGREIREVAQLGVADYWTMAVASASAVLLHGLEQFLACRPSAPSNFPFDLPASE